MVSDESSFLAAIFANPDEDTPRLAYADWLTEHDRPQRAEFIRVQCERARLPETDPKCRKLHRREDALLKEYGRQWTAELQPLIRTTSDFVRGFVEHVDVEADVLAERHETLFRLAPIRTLDLYSPNANVSLSSVHSLIRLRELTVFLGEFAPAEFRAFVRSPHLTNLKRLAFQSTLIRDAGVRALGTSRSFAALEHLTLNQTAMTLAGLESLVPSRALPQLSSLTLIQHRFGAEAGALLAASSLLGRLTSLVLIGNAIGLDGLRPLVTSPRATSLRSLTLAGEAIGDAGAECMAASSQLSQLYTLHLNDANITDAGVRAFCRSPHLLRLAELGLAENRITDAGIQSLVPSGLLRGVKRLHLWSNRIGDPGAQALAGLPETVTFTELCLQGNPISRAAKDQLRRRFGRSACVF